MSKERLPLEGVLNYMMMITRGCIIEILVLGEIVVEEERLAISLKVVLMCWGCHVARVWLHLNAQNLCLSYC